MENNGRFVDVDKKRWLVLILQILVGTATGYVYCLSIYIGPFAEQFGWNPNVIILIWSLMMVAGLPGGAIGGTINEKLGSKNALKIGGIAFAALVVLSSFSVNAIMFVVIDVAAIVAMYIIYTSQMANIGMLFPDLRGLTIGIFAGATAVGAAIIGPFAQWLTTVMDLMHGIALQGMIYGGLTFICGFLIIDAPKGYLPKNMRPEDCNEEEQLEGPTFTWIQVLTKPSFWLIFIGIAFGPALLNALSGNISLVSQTALGIGAAKGAMFYSIWQICCGAGGILIGLISDKVFGPVKTFGFMLIATAIVAIILGVGGVNHFALYMIVIILLGFAAGGVLTLTPTIALTMFGSKSFGVIFGILLCGGAIGSLIGTQISTRFSPTTLFIIGGIIALGASVTFILANVIYKRETTTK